MANGQKKWAETGQKLWPFGKKWPKQSLRPNFRGHLPGFCPFSKWFWPVDFYASTCGFVVSRPLSRFFSLIRTKIKNIYNILYINKYRKIFGFLGGHHSNFGHFFKLEVFMTYRAWLHCFAENLKELLYEARMDCKDLSEASGISTSAISRYIHEVQMPTLRSVINIAYALHVDYEDLIDFGEPIDIRGCDAVDARFTH